MNNKVFYLLFLLLNGILSGCNSTETSLDQGLKTLRVVEIKPEIRQVFYVPASLKVGGGLPGSEPASLETGNMRIVQGMVTLQFDEKEMEMLQQRVNDQLGPDFSLKQFSTGSFKISFYLNEKELNSFNVLSGNVNLPFQFSVDKDTAAKFKTRLEFVPAVIRNQTVSMMSSSASKSYSYSSSTGTPEAEASSSVQIQKKSEQSPALKEIVVEQMFEF